MVLDFSVEVCDVVEIYDLKSSKVLCMWRMLINDDCLNGIHVEMDYQHLDCMLRGE